MKIILKNTSMEFQTYTPKLNWTDSELKNAEGYLEQSQLDPGTGNVLRSPSYTTSVSALIDLANATQIVISAYNKKYTSSIAFFNSTTSDTTAVYHVQGTSSASITQSITIDSATIQAAMAEGADTFRIMMNPSDTSSVQITQ